MLRAKSIARIIQGTIAAKPFDDDNNLLKDSSGNTDDIEHEMKENIDLTQGRNVVPLDMLVHMARSRKWKRF